MILTNNAVPYSPEHGYQIWLGTWSGHRYHMAIGWGGKFIVIVPDQNLVVTATCWTSDITYQMAGEHWIRIIQIILKQILHCVY
ncbi:MAG: hypothetical protein MUE74_04305 [Bacteroidales bacterium]|nr:hypothetical protein [Bacteroidales bacterium]